MTDPALQVALYLLAHSLPATPANVAIATRAVREAGK